MSGGYAVQCTVEGMQSSVQWRVCSPVYSGGYAVQCTVEGMQSSVQWRVCSPVYSGGNAVQCTVHLTLINDCTYM